MARKGRAARIYEPGDVFSVALPGGWYGAVRILARHTQGRSEEWYLAATTPYLELEPPVFDDPRLGEVLNEVRFHTVASPALLWHSGPPPRELTYLGNLPPSSRDVPKFPSPGLTGGWKLGVSNALYEWRWVHDREAYEAESRANSAAALARYKAELRKQKPKAMLADDDFWSLINLLERPGTDQARQEAGLERLTEALSRRTKTDIKRFAEALAYHLYELDSRAHAEASDMSDDGFLYARCWVVADGRETYEAVRADPARMPSDPDLEFEALLYAASAAHERKSGDALEYETGCSFETGSNLAGWPDAT